MEHKSNILSIIYCSYMAEILPIRRKTLSNQAFLFIVAMLSNIQHKNLKQ